MDRLAERIQRLRPGIINGFNFILLEDGSGLRLAAWDQKFDPIPTDEELLAVDLTQPTTEQRDRQTLKALKAKAESGDIDAADVKQIVKLLLKREG